MQEFGSVWTEAKLDAIERYLDLYTKALKNLKFNLCYIDAFAGSGSITLKGGVEIEGSATRALKYPFDKYYFFEKDKKVIETLEQKTNMVPDHKEVEYRNADCNSFLFEIDSKNWIKDHWRGVIFIDPFAMDLDWSCLNKISNTRVFDVWYLIPFMAINRNLKRDGKVAQANKEKITRFLGTTDWENELYQKSLQLSYLDGTYYQKTSINNIKNFILSRLKQTFPTVSDKAIFLRNSKNSPQFLLCFAGSNPNSSAKMLSLKLANYVLTRM